MKKSRKGFTIVELVIVIAVIAILAAVLIPTFSGLIRKAKISADTQLCKNMNTSLSAAEAEGKEIGNINDVIDILYDAGYVLANLNPSAEGYWYAWDSETNQMLYLDETFSVSFHVRELKTAEANEKWIVVVSGADDYAQVKAAGCTPSASVVEDAAAFLQAIEAGDNVILSGDLTLTGYDKDNPLTVDYSDVVIDLNGHSMTIGARSAFRIEGENVVIKNGVFNLEEAGYGMTLSGAKNARIENVTMKGSLNATQGTTVTLKDVVIVSTGAYNICAQEGSTVTVESGTFIKDILQSYGNYMIYVRAGYYYYGTVDPGEGFGKEPEDKSNIMPASRVILKNGADQIKFQSACGASLLLSEEGGKDSGWTSGGVAYYCYDFASGILENPHAIAVENTAA